METFTLQNCLKGFEMFLFIFVCFGLLSLCKTQDLGLKVTTEWLGTEFIVTSIMANYPGYEGGKQAHTTTLPEPYHHDGLFCNAVLVLC